MIVFSGFSEYKSENSKYNQLNNISHSMFDREICIFVKIGVCKSNI